MIANEELSELFISRQNVKVEVIFLFLFMDNVLSAVKLTKFEYAMG